MKSSNEWITENFQMLVSKYGGRYIGVINNKVIAVAITPKEVIEKAKKLGKNEEEVSLLKVPKEEEMSCIL